VTEPLNIRVWEDDSGELVPVTTIQSFQGSEHCDWQDITFLLVGPEENPDQYVRDTTGELAEHLLATFDADAELPDQATDTGFHRGGRQLWLGDPRPRTWSASTTPTTSSGGQPPSSRSGAPELMGDSSRGIVASARPHRNHRGDAEYERRAQGRSPRFPAPARPRREHQRSTHCSEAGNRAARHVRDNRSNRAVPTILGALRRPNIMMNPATPASTPMVRPMIVATFMLRSPLSMLRLAWALPRRVSAQRDAPTPFSSRGPGEGPALAC
jgi:hypothetical protein